MKKETKEWLKIAHENRELAELMWKTKRYVYAVMFWQQSVEKILKAYIIETKKVLPKRTHDIDKLLQQANLNIAEKSYKNTKELTFAFIRTRYSDLSRQYYSKKLAVEPLVHQAEKLFLWIKGKFRDH